MFVTPFGLSITRKRDLRTCALLVRRSITGIEEKVVVSSQAAPSVQEEQ